MESSSYNVDSTFIYKNKKIKFYSYSYIDNQFLKSPFIYSDKTIIDLNDERDAYYFKFKTGIYYDTNVFLRSKYESLMIYIPFDECKVKQREMTCKLTRKRIENFYYYNSRILSPELLTINFGFDYGTKINEIVYPIFLSKVEKQKETVHVTIKKLLTKEVGSSSFLAYETDVYNISSIHTRAFLLRFSNNKNYDYDFTCTLKKKKIIIHYCCFV